MMSALSLPRYRCIVALDIERSTSRPNPVRAELRSKMYELFEIALSMAGVHERYRDRFVDRGDGILALIHPVEQLPEDLLLNRAVPVLNQLLADYNASLPRPSRPHRQLQVRVAMHAGEIHYDANGCFGEALDVAFRMLDAPQVKKALRETAGPLVLVVSDDIYKTIIRHSYDIDRSEFQPLVVVRLANKRYKGWVHVPGPEPATKSHEHQDLMRLPIPGAAFSAIYQALERHLVETEEPYDVEAGLAKLKEWMSTERVRL
jgi:hypothetical protein